MNLALKPPPGCPVREVVATAVAPGGMYVKLDCSHVMFIAGPVLDHDQWPCLYGCYVPQRGFGDQC